MAFETTPARTAARDRLVEVLLATAIDGTVTHQKIRETLGERTTSPDALKHAAMKVAAEQAGAIFENIRGIGYRRIPACDIHRVGVMARQSIRSKARRSSKRMSSAMTVNSNSMTNQERLRVHTEVSLLGMIQASAGRGALHTAMQAAEGAASGRQGPPSYSDVASAISAAFTR